VVGEPVDTEEVRYLVKTGAGDTKKLSSYARRHEHPEALAWHETGTTNVCLDRIHVQLNSNVPRFMEKPTEEQLILTIVTLDVHESLHGVISFPRDEGTQKSHAAIGALMGLIDDLARAGAYGLYEGVM